MILVVLVAALCIRGGAYDGKACAACHGCKKDWKFDDHCVYFDGIRGGDSCQDVGMCWGIQKKHDPDACLALVTTGREVS